ncbi:MAG: hypothetical protein L6Q76_32060 [Polyangiaceae bacterium]|nr:hypothetical protein [Polyangiaceae bacterium]
MVISPWIPTAIFPTPPATSRADAAIVGTPATAPTPVEVSAAPMTPPVMPPSVVNIPRTICPMASPRLASGVPGGSMSAASSNCCPMPANGTSPSATPAANPPRSWPCGDWIHASASVTTTWAAIAAELPVASTSVGGAAAPTSPA